MKKAMIMIGSILGGLLLVIGVVFGIYAYRNMNYDNHIDRTLSRAGYVEKQVMLPDGTVLNYGEGPNNGGEPLFLIHGQGCNWKDYVNVFPTLNKTFHVYAIDCHGHGKSSFNPAKYNVNEMGEDFTWFLQNVIGKPAIVSGNSSGGILSAWLAANAPESVKGIVLEDPPYFSTEAERRPKLFTWVDAFEPVHRFLNQTEEKNFTRFYLHNTQFKKMFGKSWDSIVKYGDAYIAKHPDKPLRFFFLPKSLNRAFDLMSVDCPVVMPVGNMDLRFADTFYDCSWFNGFDRTATLRAIRCPATLLHANWFTGPDNMLMGAMSDDDAKRVKDLIHGCQTIRIDSGHDIHYGAPRAFEKAILDFYENRIAT